MESIDRASARRKANKVALLVLLGSFVWLLLVGTLIFVNKVAFREPLQARGCECALLEDLLLEFPILDDGGTLVGEFDGRASEWGVSASLFQRGKHLDEDRRSELVFAMKEQGMNLDVVGLSSEDQWHLRVFPGELVNGGFVPNEPWVFHVIDSEMGGLALRVNVHVPGEGWGIGSLDALYDLHQDDPIEAARIETERQREAIRMLAPVMSAAEAMR